MKTYKSLNVEDIIELHDMLIKDFGGMEGIFPETEGRIGAILDFMFAEYYGEELYVGLFNKAAYLLYSLIKNHCFPDGNKRIAFNSCEIFLYINGYELCTDKFDFVKLVKDIAASKHESIDMKCYIFVIAKTLHKNSIYK